MSEDVIAVPECITKISSNVCFASQFGFQICILLVNLALECVFLFVNFVRKLLKEDMRWNVFEVSVHS